MIAIRHAGIYVDDIRRLEEFYTAVFQMIPICSMEPARGKLFEELFSYCMECLERKKKVTAEELTNLVKSGSI